MSSSGQSLSSTLDIKQFNEVMEKAADQHARSSVDTTSMSIRWQGDVLNRQILEIPVMTTEQWPWPFW